jgi:hypothetical protein
MILRPDNAPQLVGIDINNSGNYTVSWSGVGWTTTYRLQEALQFEYKGGISGDELLG